MAVSADGAGARYRERPGGRPGLAAAATSLKTDGAAGVDCGKVYAFAGNDLYLNGSHEVAYANDAVTLTITAGKPGNLAILVLTELDGTPLFEVITPYLAFDGNGEITLDEEGDPAWGPHDVTLQAWAVGRNRKLIQSSERVVLLR